MIVIGERVPTIYCAFLQVRLLQKGAYMIAGVRYAKVVGENLDQKLKYLSTEAGIAAFMDKATKSSDGDGFWLLHGEVGSLVIVPAGYLIANVGVLERGNGGEEKKGEGFAAGLRWGFLDAQDQKQLETTQAMCKDMLSTFKELDATPYRTWLDTLEKFLMPAVS